MHKAVSNFFFLDFFEKEFRRSRRPIFKNSLSQTIIKTRDFYFLQRSHFFHGIKNIS
jgi:hypothetical protein